MRVENVITPSAAGLSHAARLLKVMGHPARLQILQFVEGGEETVTSIQEYVGLTQAMTSQHLKLLFETGLVHRRRQGTSIYYRITKDLGQKMLNCMRECPEIWGSPSEGRKEF